MSLFAHVCHRLAITSAQAPMISSARKILSNAESTPPAIIQEATTYEILYFQAPMELRVARGLRLVSPT